MTRNEFEHYLVMVEAEEKPGPDGQAMLDIVIKPIAADLSPEKPVTLRQVSKEEFPDNIDAYVEKCRESMDIINDRFVDQVIAALKKDKEEGTDRVKYHGYVELVEQLQNAPHILLANMTASMLAGIAQITLEDESATQQA